MSWISPVIFAWSFLLSTCHVSGRGSSSPGSGCLFPTEYHGRWFSSHRGQDSTVTVNSLQWGDYSCRRLHYHTENWSKRHVETTMTLFSRDRKCYSCLDVIWRAPNVLQTRMTECSPSERPPRCPGIRRLPAPTELSTLFAVNRSADTKCDDAISGVFEFTYSISWAGPGFCGSHRNVAVACKNVPYPSNNVQWIMMRFGQCPGIVQPEAEVTSGDDVLKFNCYGTWNVVDGDRVLKFAALHAPDVTSQRSAYRCLVTSFRLLTTPGVKQYRLSESAECKDLGTDESLGIKMFLSKKKGVEC